MEYFGIHIYMNMMNTKIGKTKQYHLADLLDNYEQIIARCTLIEQVSQAVNFIPNTRIIIKDDILLYEQEFIQKKSSRLISIDKKYQLLNEFASI